MSRHARRLVAVLACALAVVLTGHALAAAGSTSFTIAGSFQTEVGCATDWDPACTTTDLTFDVEDDVWQGTFNVPAGSYMYKGVTDHSWANPHFGLYGQNPGTDIPTTVATTGPVKFYYDHETHWVTDNQRSLIVTAVGNFQSELGCTNDNDAACLRSWMQDVDEDDTYVAALAVPAGTWSAQAALNESALQGTAQSFTVPAGQALTYFIYNGLTGDFLVSNRPPAGNLSKARAHWIDRGTIAWPTEVAPAGNTAYLHYASAGGLSLTPGGVTGGSNIQLTHEPLGLTGNQRIKWPHLASAKVFKLALADIDNAQTYLRGQLAVSIEDPAGDVLDASAVQLPGVLDDLFATTAPLGVTWNAGVPTLSLWAPTATAVSAHIYDTAQTTTINTTLDLTYDTATGVWSATGNAGMAGKFYLYEVRVFVPSEKGVMTNLVTDPYSVSLSTNSKRSQLVDLADAALKPAGWDALAKPPLEAPEDIVLYELHIRDFSANDPSVPAERKGTYKAFTDPNTHGMRHLARLAAAGLTHVHLLPPADIATINEDKTTWQSPGDLSAHAPDSQAQQAAINNVRDQDAFNWGYDPFHFNVPEGSYATDPNGSARILEFRELVSGLAAANLRTVIDVVFNHTTASGQNEKSVLDKIVPGYYHRLNADGFVEKSTCCDNTATEHAMMERLMIDSVVMWARDYKVDGFRFDLMGHQPKAAMLKLRDRLAALTQATDGVDGSKIYLYGEGWNFGEVADNARFIQATQPNMGGTGIGTYSDRLRDAVRGGGPFGPLQDQGFATGLFTDPNGNGISTNKQRLFILSDLLRLGMAGNLKAFTFVDSNGREVNGTQVGYQGGPAGYAEDPQDVINYVSKHDNETIFDAVQLKASATTPIEERARMSRLAIATVLLSQGVPFLHAGDELLRSKSLDRNSYNSGDWFNRIDWTYQTNNWGVGLPMEQDNKANWSVMGPLLADADLRVTPALIQSSLEAFESYLKVRKSTPLLRLRTGQEILDQVTMHNTGPDQIPGLVVMKVEDPDAAQGTHDTVVVLINADDEAVTFEGGEPLKNKGLALHPALAEGTDEVVKTATYGNGGNFKVPGRSAVVFVHVAGESIGCASCSAIGAGPAWVALAAALLALRARRRR